MTALKLKVSPDLTLPINFVTDATAMLGRRGSGKSNAAVYLVELLSKIGVPFAVLDPKGDWWGIQSNAAGDGPGLPVPVFGGLHGNLPLEATAGALMAHIVAEQKISCVLDLSDFSKRQQVQFSLDFAKTLFQIQRRSPDPFHLIAEEADELAPQVTMGRTGGSDEGPQTQMVGAMARIAKQGRNFGLGLTILAQRSASVSKNVLTQVGSIVAFRNDAEIDVKAIVGWVRDTELRKEVAATLPTLTPGRSLVISPEFVGPNTALNVEWYRRTTFDSGATPSFGEVRVTPKTLADIDLGEIADLMAETVERAKADDPAELRKEIKKLRAELTEARADQPDPEVVEVEIVTPEMLTALGDAGRSLGVALRQPLEDLQSITGDLIAAIARVKQPSPSPLKMKPLERPTTPRPSTSAAVELSGLNKCERAVLTVLVHSPDGRTRNQVATLSGYAANSSSLDKAFASLRRQNFMDMGTPMHATPDGIEILGDDVALLPTGEKLLTYWMGKINKAERAVLQVFLDHYPAEIDRQMASDGSGYDYGSSSLDKALAALRRLELIDGWRARPDFVESVQ